MEQWRDSGYFEWIDNFGGNFEDRYFGFEDGGRFEHCSYFGFEDGGRFEHCLYFGFEGDGGFEG